MLHCTAKNLKHIANQQTALIIQQTRLSILVILQHWVIIMLIYINSTVKWVTSHLCRLPKILTYLNQLQSQVKDTKWDKYVHVTVSGKVTWSTCSAVPSLFKSGYNLLRNMLLTLNICGDAGDHSIAEYRDIFLLLNYLKQHKIIAGIVVLYIHQHCFLGWRHKVS